MPSALMEHAKTHLEFLGYTLSPVERDRDLDVMKVTRPGGFTFSCFASEHIIRFVYYFATKKGEQPGCFKFINSLNLGSRLISFCKNDFDTLVCQADFYGAYNKATFALFASAWDYDMGIVLRERVEEFLTYME